jgi:hypothetical protein
MGVIDPVQAHIKIKINAAVSDLLNVRFIFRSLLKYYIIHIFFDIENYLCPRRPGGAFEKAPPEPPQNF